MLAESKEKDKLTRAFICIDFPDEVVKEVARVQELLEKWNFIGKITELENLHLTLKFLGEIDDLKIEEIKNALREIKFGKFEAKLGNTRIFHFNGNPKIVWIKILGKCIYELQRKIGHVLEKEGFRSEERFMGHLTIDRIKYTKDKKGFEAHVKKINAKSIGFTINNFKLMKSELREQGPVYSKLGEYFLAG
ncbi:MAG: RNA 2',3'-cyclic phosphodiesterase [Nanoarchaeota archaeon]